ncbi:MAG: hypothetical protein PHV52_00075 [Aliarcobacter sp.]|nr:hypothetical protein [Aliarcobacter sp.]
MIYIAIAKAILEVAVNDTFINDPDIISIHKNKKRKEYKKIKEGLEFINKKIENVYYRLEERDGNNAQVKAVKLAVPFIKTLSKYKDVSLELLSITVFDYGLNRKRKTKLNPALKPFADYRFLYGKLAAKVEEAGVRENEKEVEIIKELMKSIKYK